MLSNDYTSNNNKVEASLNISSNSASNSKLDDDSIIKIKYDSNKDIAKHSKFNSENSHKIKGFSKGNSEIDIYKITNLIEEDHDHSSELKNKYYVDTIYNKKNKETKRKAEININDKLYKNIPNINNFQYKQVKKDSVFKKNNRREDEYI